MVALILQAQNRPGEAQSQYEHILATSPRSVVAANNLAWLSAERGGNLDVALGLAQTAAQQAPDEPKMNDTLGWIYYKKGLPGAGNRRPSAQRREKLGQSSLPLSPWIGLCEERRPSQSETVVG